MCRNTTVNHSVLFFISLIKNNTDWWNDVPNHSGLYYNNKILQNYLCPSLVAIRFSCSFTFLNGVMNIYLFLYLQRIRHKCSMLSCFFLSWKTSKSHWFETELIIINSWYWIGVCALLNGQTASEKVNLIVNALCIVYLYVSIAIFHEFIISSVSTALPI